MHISFVIFTEFDWQYTNGFKTISDGAGTVISSGNIVTGDFTSTGIVNSAASNAI
jgi:hypothetical protein